MWYIAHLHILLDEIYNIFKSEEIPFTYLDF